MANTFNDKKRHNCINLKIWKLALEIANDISLGSSSN